MGYAVVRKSDIKGDYMEVWAAGEEKVSGEVDRYDSREDAEERARRFNLARIDREAAAACARGSWQAEIVSDLVRYGKVTNPCKWLQGRAKSYSGRYEMSWRNLRNRLREEAGIEVYVKELGPRGGMWSAVWAVRQVEA